MDPGRSSPVTDDPTDPAPRADDQPTPALIEHILARYHEPHRAALADLIPLAARVECVHDEAPRGLAGKLEALRAELESHMAKEENVLFPMMLRGGHPMIAAPIGVMRHEHDGAADLLAEMRTLTGGFALPAGACGSWTRLYTGLDRLATDLTEHIRLENEVLFPRFELEAV
jgi:regulator of cell morphogenesis and NO signaling